MPTKRKLKEEFIRRDKELYVLFRGDTNPKEYYSCWNCNHCTFIKSDKDPQIFICCGCGFTFEVVK